MKTHLKSSPAGFIAAAAVKPSALQVCLTELIKSDSSSAEITMTGRCGLIDRLSDTETGPPGQKSADSTTADSCMSA